MPLRMTGVAKWPFIGNFKFEHARDLILVSIPMVLGLRNSFGLEWPFMAILASKMAILVTFCFQHTRDWFWCLFPAFWAWEIHWAHFQVPQIDLNGQIIHLSISGRWWWFPKNQSALVRHATVNRSALTHLATVNCSGLTCQATMNHSVVTFQKLRGRSALTFQTLRGRSVAS